MTRTLATLLAALALAVAGCGSGDESTKNAGGGGGGGGGGSTGGGGQQLALSAPADGSLKFDKTALQAKPGTVTINFDNQSESTPHAVEIEGQTSEIVTKAETSVTVDLKAGKYTFFCPVGGHRQEGMEGTLTVK
jgi:plastocyanin